MLFKRKKESTSDTKISIVPKNVAIIMDGNGRWAKKKNMPVSFGHSQGVSRIEDVVRVAIDQGVETVSVYAFSTENWSRSDEEVNHLLNLIFKFYESKAKELMDNGVRIRFPGSKMNVPANVLELFSKMENESKEKNTLNLNICFNYGSRLEITDSVNEFIRKNPGKEITETDITNNLYKGIQENVDLLIRTSGEERLSNYMLWQNSYSEFVFAEVLWPDFTEVEFMHCLEVYSKRNRRFGGR